MKRVISSVSLLCFAITLGVQAAPKERNKWRISVGGAFNGAVKSSISTRNLPVPAAPTHQSTAAYSSQAEAKAAMDRGDYGSQGFIYDDAQTTDGQPYTTNWKISSGTKTGTDGDGTSTFTLENQYEGIDPTKVSYSRNERDASDDEYQFGISAEISRELWAKEVTSEDEHCYGIDLAVAFSYFFERDIYRTYGESKRTDTYTTGKYVTTVKDAAATWDYDHEGQALVDGQWYGEGTGESAMSRIGGPTLNLNCVTKNPEPQGVTSCNLESSLPYSAKGDYQELELLFMFRPWYDITDWWRVFVEGGVGVSWGRFDSSFHSAGVRKSEDFDQWDCYGVAGLGTMVSYDDFSLMFDIFGRFLRDDFDVHGKYVDGTIERADWGFRVMVGYSF